MCGIRDDFSGSVASTVAPSFKLPIRTGQCYRSAPLKCTSSARCEVSKRVRSGTALCDIALTG